MAEAFIDITREVCPMTFVRVKLRLESLNPGDTLEIRLNGGEPLENVPRALKDEGCEVGPARADGDHYRITARKGARCG